MAHFQVVWRRGRKLQASPELDQYPTTPAGYYTGYYPASGAVDANRIEFNQGLQSLPELDVYPSSVVPGQPVTAWQNPASFRVGLRRRLQANELNEYPATPVGYYTGHFPGSARVAAIRSEFRQSRQRLPELNSFPATPVAVVLSAWAVHFERTRNATRRRRLSFNLDVYPATPAGYYSGYYPGSGLARANRNEYVQRLQLAPEFNGWPVAVTTLTSADLDNIANAVWSELRAGYTNSATFGGFTQSKLLTVAKWLGLR